MTRFGLSDQVAFGMIIVIVLIGICRLIQCCLKIDKKYPFLITTTHSNNIKISFIIVLNSIIIILLLRET